MSFALCLVCSRDFDLGRMSTPSLLFGSSASLSLSVLVLFQHRRCDSVFPCVCCQVELNWSSFFIILRATYTCSSLMSMLDISVGSLRRRGAVDKRADLGNQMSMRSS